MNPHPPVILARAAALALMAAGLCGCTGGHAPTEPGTATGAQDGPALGALRTLSNRQSTRPDERVMDAPPPPGLEALAGSASDSPGDQALPLADVLQRLAMPVEPPPESIRVTSDAEAIAALRLYTSGREKLLRGDAPGALADLQRATELDPGSGEPWLALGEAQSASGARAEALVATERAARLGTGGARPWEVLGRSSLSVADWSKSAAYLSRAALEQQKAPTDPALGGLIGIELGQALDSLGYARAAMEAMAGSLQLIESAQGTQRYRTEIAAIARRRADLWTRVGDLACRAGDFGRAAEAYDTAWALPAFGTGREGLPARRMFADLRIGHPADAAWALLDAIKDHSGWVGDSDLALCSYLRDHGGRDAPEAMSDVLDEYGRTRAPAPTPALAGSLALARAALLDPDRASRVLNDRLATVPGDDRAALALVMLANEESLRGAVRTTVELTRRTPLRDETYARTLLDLASLNDILAELGSPGASPAADLLAARLLLAADDAAGAMDRLDHVAEHRPQDNAVAVDLAVAQAAATIGGWDRVDRSLEALRLRLSGTDPASALWASAGCLAAAQRFSEALDMLRVLADAPPDADASAATRVERLLAAGELASRLALGADAERWLRRAVDIDPHDERVHARLIELYSPGGAQPDQAKFNEALRRLRQSCPEGRVVRTLRTQDLLRRGATDEARKQDLELLRDDPTDGAAIDLLAEASERLAASQPAGGASDEAEAFLRQRVAIAPDDAALVVALARVLAATDRAGEAESLLKDSLTRRPRRDISRALERLLRRTPDRAAEADRIALERLNAAEGSVLSPRSITESIELAELLQHLGRTAEAVSVLQSGIPASAMLTPTQGQVLIDVAARATEGQGNESNDPGLALLDFAAERKVHLPQELHRRRLVLLVSDPLVRLDHLVAAARDLQADYPELGSVPLAVVFKGLLSSDAPMTPGQPWKSSRAMAFADLASQNRPDAEFLFEWLRGIGVAGDAADAKRLIEAALTAKIEGDLIRRIESDSTAAGIAAPPTPTGPQGAAELAQIVGDLCAVEGRPDVAADMYRLSLSYDPGHTWSANNLGYHLAETARHLDGTIDTAALEESERLLAGAAAALPDDGSVLDSLGWVRYRKGELVDQKDDAGNVVVEGAVTLLTRAAKSSKGESNETILDHLGDALWRVGEHDSAAGAWSVAEIAARQRLDRLRNAAASRSSIEEVSDVLGRVATKLAAVRSGMPPEVGWTISNP